MNKIKATVFMTAALLALTGCQNTTEQLSEPLNSTSSETQSCTIKWCLTECGLNSTIIGALNDELHKDGCQYEIELVEIPHSAEKTYSEQVLEYEAANGSLDIVSAGYAFSNDASAGYDFVKSGYFMPLDSLSDYTEVPEKLWETVKVNDTVYTVPGLNFNDSGVTFYFNKTYISEQQINDFNGDISKLGSMLNGLTASDDFVPIFFDIDYTDYAKSFPYSAKGGLLLDNASRSAENPYELDWFVDYARTLNDLYNKGLFGKRINFSKYDFSMETLPKDFAVMVSPVLNGADYFEEIGYGDMELTSYTLPVFLENRVLYSNGIAANSGHKEQALDFLRRIYSDAKYARIILDGTGVERMSVGIHTNDVKELYNSAELSDFAGFELSASDMDIELKDLLTLSFDKLCKSQDFDNTLDEINSELHSSGIDDYINSVNKLLEEQYAPSNQ